VLRRVLDLDPSGSGIDLSWKLAPGERQYRLSSPLGQNFVRAFV